MVCALPESPLRAPLLPARSKSDWHGNRIYVFWFGWRMVWFSRKRSPCSTGLLPQG